MRNQKVCNLSYFVSFCHTACDLQYHNEARITYKYATVYSYHGGYDKFEFVISRIDNK